MRSYKLASLILLAGVWSVACNGSDSSGDGDGDTGGDGDGGLVGGDGDGDVGDGDVGDGDVGDGDVGDGDVGDGDGDGPHAGCANTEVASGTALIDDFDTAAFPNLPDGNASTVGTWGHSYWDYDSDGMVGAELPARVADGDWDDEDNGAAYLEVACEADSADTPWCNVEWDMASPWAQWASIDLVLAPYSETEDNCFDAGAYTGIKFKARSAAEGNSVRVQINTPDADSETGETYQGPELALGTDWEEFEVPFSMIAQPSWSTITTPLATNALMSISWVVRTRVDQEDADMVVGETLAPYNIQLDDVQFY